MFSPSSGYFLYAVEAPVVLAIILIFVYIMHSLNLFKKP